MVRDQPIASLAVDCVDLVIARGTCNWKLPIPATEVSVEYILVLPFRYTVLSITFPLVRLSRTTPQTYP